VVKPVGEEDEANRVSVVVAEVNLEPYERLIDAKMVKRIKYPEALMPRYSALDVKDVVGRLPTDPIYRGEIISLSRLVDKDDYGASLRRLIPPDHRALAVLVSAITGAAFVSQGDMVDLAAVYPQALTAAGRGRGQQSTDMARIILQNIKVLIVGNKYNPVYQENPAGVIEGELTQKPVTFAVLPVDAAKIHHVAQNRSTFRMLLKNSEDKDLLETEGYSRQRLEQETRDILKPKAPEEGPTKKAVEVTEVKVVEVYKGCSKANDETFRVTVKQQ
jgi:Flp pilus assembly protein CpaB